MVQRLEYRKVQRLNLRRLDQRKRSLQREHAQLHGERLGDYNSWYNQHKGTDALTRSSNYYTAQVRQGQITFRELERAVDGMGSLNSRDRDWIFNKVVLDQVERERGRTRAIRESAKQRKLD